MSLSPPHTSTLTRRGGTPRGPEKGAPRAALPVRPLSVRHSRRNPFLDLPIAWRLALGFLVAALVASLAAGIVGIQRSQSLSRQTNFYHNLLQLNTSLTNGRNFLELMNSELQQTFEDASAANVSQETLTDDKNAIAKLTTLYTQTLDTYTQTSLLEQHPEQLALLAEAGESILATQQKTLTDSARRTWLVYAAAQQEILNSIASHNLTDARNTFQEQGQVTHGDALSALQSLIQLNDRLASAVDAATNAEMHNQLLTVIIASISAFLAIALVGWFISETLVRRLRDLHRVTRAVEEGRIDERVQVTGRDEIADVSLAFNAMIETISRLLEETRQQRDALAGAAEHLFSDMRIVNAGDLRINATVSDDPIGMLANAFNFTVGRFRRFILRTQTTVEQLDVVARQSREHSLAFVTLVRTYMRDGEHSQRQSSATAPLVKDSRPLTKNRASRPGLNKPPHLQNMPPEGSSRWTLQLQQVQDELLHATRDELGKHLQLSREMLERLHRSVSHLSDLLVARSGASTGHITEKMTQTQLQELVSLETLLGKLSWEIQQTQMTSTMNFTRMDTALTRLARLAAEQPAHASDASEETPGPSDVQFQEFIRQAGGFGADVHTFSRRLGAIVQEMRVSITPFHLEGSGGIEESGQALSTSFPVE